MLAVVDDEQQIFAHQPAQDRPVTGASLLAHAQRLGDDAANQLRVANRSEINKPHAVGIAIEELRTDLDCKACLAHAA